MPPKIAVYLDANQLQTLASVCESFIENGCDEQPDDEGEDDQGPFWEPLYDLLMFAFYAATGIPQGATIQ
jgi:hypothetical protein